MIGCLIPNVAVKPLLQGGECQDSVRWLAETLTGDQPEIAIGVYVGASRSGLIRDGRYARMAREPLKQMRRTLKNGRTPCAPGANPAGFDGSTAMTGPAPGLEAPPRG